MRFLTSKHLTQLRGKLVRSWGPSLQIGDPVCKLGISQFGGPSSSACFLLRWSVVLARASRPCTGFLADTLWDVGLLPSINPSVVGKDMTKLQKRNNLTTRRLDLTQGVLYLKFAKQTLFSIYGKKI